MENLKKYAFATDKLVVAHRGDSGNYPENTVIAVTKAIESGAKIIEIDVQFTKDNQIIVFHDDALGRTAQGTKKIYDINYEVLKNLDAGSWFAPEFSSERIPLLNDIIDIIDEKAYLMLEVKSYNNADYSKKFEMVFDLINNRNYIGNTLFASFDYKFLYSLKSFCPEANTAAIKIPNMTIDPAELRENINFDAYICSIDEVNKSITDYLYEKSIIVGVYGVDSIEDFLKVKDYQLKAYGTNYPGLIIDTLKNNTPHYSKNNKG